MKEHRPIMQGDPRRLPSENQYNQVADMDPQIADYVRNLVLKVVQNQEILRRDERNRMIATTGGGFSLKKKNEGDFIVGSTPVE